jgi:hypothetical protein
MRGVSGFPRRVSRSRSEDDDIASDPFSWRLIAAASIYRELKGREQVVMTL